VNHNIQLRQARGRLAKQMQEIVDRGMNTPEDQLMFDRIDAEQRGLKEQIDRIERADETYKEIRRTGPPPNGQPGREDLDNTPTTEHERSYKKAFNSYLRRGRVELTMEERAILRVDSATASFNEVRDMGTSGQGAYPGITSGGGIFVPVGFYDKVEEAMKYYGPMLQGGRGMPTIMDTDSGQPLPLPTANDTTVTGELIGENQQVSTADVNIGMLMMGAFKFSSKLVKVSLELMEDSAFDMEAFLIRLFAERLGRSINSYATTGSGTNQPTGLVTATLAGGLLATAVGSFANDGVGGANTLGSDDLVTLEHLVDPLYRPGARYMFSDPVLKSLKQIKDKYGRPLWVTGVRDREPDTINGYEYSINSSMASLQTQASSPQVTNTTVLFGALEKFIVRRVKQMSVLRLGERFADFGQVAFLAFARYDTNLLDAGTHPIGALQNTY
jgi:HK97 family phage major capsid protein